MPILFDKLILFAGCTLLFFHWAPQLSLLHVIALLASIIFLCLCSCCNLEGLPLRQLSAHSRPALISLWALLAVSSLFHPALGFLLPFLFYELSLACHGYSYFAAGILPFLSLRGEQAFYPWAVLLLYLLAWILAFRTKELLRLKREFRLLRDTTTEYNLLLQQKNRNLAEKQNHEIHIATLKERNRIAREIHDNVGHMLSRSLLQSGALMAINQQESLKAPLEALKGSLSSAMDAIRTSVHGLHDDSIDLESAIKDLFSDFTSCQIRLDYDMGRFIPSPVKYCFIAITKEALSNIARHSNADAVSITLREHPGFYQLMIEDNGDGLDLAKKDSPGLGLKNMKERAESLNGHFSLSTERGFRIFVSVPGEKADAQ